MVNRAYADAAMVVSEVATASTFVWASPLRPIGTGVGVVQRQVYSRLSAFGIQIDSPRESSNRWLRVLLSSARVVGPPHRAALVTVTPCPLTIRVPFIVFVYDLRWRRTRGPISRLYRYLDLCRTVSKAAHVFAISERTRDELYDVVPVASGKCTVLHLGTGVVDEVVLSPGEPGTVLFLGRAAYKRNELLAEAFIMARPSWAQRFLCVGVSDPTFRTLVQGFGETSCERLDNIDDQTMRRTLRRASVYVSASMEEGFGLPMVEALASGCQVVAIDQPLLTEILGNAAVPISDGDATHIAEQLLRPAWVPEDVRRERLAMFSWDYIARSVADEIERLVSDGSETS